MTRKDHVRLAAALRLARTNAIDKDSVDLATRLIADELSEDNPRFDKTRFLFAAGIGVPVEGSKYAKK